MIHLLHASLQRSTERYPDRVALRYQGNSMTYADLHRRSAQLAHLLRDAGIQRGDRVGLFMMRNFETVIAIYGVMMAGAAYVPIDPQSPQKRLTHIVNSCAIKAILTQPDKASVITTSLPQMPTLTLVVGIPPQTDMDIQHYEWTMLEQLPDTVPAIHMTDQDLAYIIFTSGSTGQPKGITHTHLSGMSYNRIMASLCSITPDDRSANTTPSHFDISTFDYLTMIYCGASLVLVPEMVPAFPASLSKLLQDERASLWFTTPFSLSQLVLRGVIDQRDLSALRWILFGGEPMTVKHLRDLMTQLPDTRFTNIYGPAETNAATYYHVPPPQDWSEDFITVPIGSFMNNSDGLVLNEADEVVEIGEVGELVVRSSTVMRGYWNRPDLNERAFYRRQIVSGYEHTYYRTGDLVRLRADGLYDFIGRRDHQVKIRGFRVELAEVDRAMTAHPTVEASCAYVMHLDDHDELHAAVKPQTDDAQAITTNELLAYLRQQLPHYAVPTKIHFVDALPLTSTGKINRRVVQAQAAQHMNK